LDDQEVADPSSNIAQASRALVGSEERGLSQIKITNGINTAMMS